MRTKLIGLTLCSAITTNALAINPFKMFALAVLGANAVVSGEKNVHCPGECPWYQEYDYFGDYLESLTNCEKEALFPFMRERFDFIREVNTRFKELNEFDEDIVDRKDAVRKVRHVDNLYRHEVKLFKRELVETQRLLFDECTGDESKEALAKHAAVLAEMIDAHTQYIEFFKTLGD